MTQPPPPSYEAFHGPVGDVRRWFALAVLLLAASLTLVSITSINVALPAIRQGIEIDGASLSLLLTGYALAFGLTLVPAGWLGDRQSHKWVFVVGVVVFAAGNAWSGVATDDLQLVASRILCGFGAGLLITPITALIQLLFHGPERARPFAILGAVYGVSTAIGPLIGGLLIQAGGDAGWRLVFWVNVPLAIVAAVLAVVLIPRDRTSADRGGDPLGMVLLAAAVIALMLPFSRGTGVDLGGALLLTAGVVLLVLYASWERRRSARGRVALSPVRMFRDRSFPVGLAVSFLGFGAFTSSFLALSLLWQDGLGHTPLETGLLVLPYALASVAGALTSRRVWMRWGTRTVVLALALMVVGLGAMAVVLLALPAASAQWWELALPLAFLGAGSGLFVGPNTNRATSAIDRQDAGVASGMVGTAQRSGTVLGVGIIAAIMAHTTGSANAQSVAGIALVACTVFAVAGLAVQALLDRSPARTGR